MPALNSIPLDKLVRLIAAVVAMLGMIPTLAACSAARLILHLAKSDRMMGSSHAFSWTVTAVHLRPSDLARAGR